MGPLTMGPLTMGPLTMGPLTMGPKRSSSNSTEKEKSKVVRTTIRWKKEIIAQFDIGVRVSDLSAQYNIAKYTISTFLNNKEAIRQLMLQKERRLFIDSKGHR